MEEIADTYFKCGNNISGINPKAKYYNVRFVNCDFHPNCKQLQFTNCTFVSCSGIRYIESIRTRANCNQVLGGDGLLAAYNK